MIPHKILQLNLSESQTQNLTQLNQNLGEKLEQYGTLRPEMMADLTAAMKAILDTQSEYPSIAAEARNLQTQLHLTYDDPNILNLPWRLATQHLSNLYLTKGKSTDGDLPILKADNPPLKILVMISSPEDSDYDSRLSYEEEEDQIIQAFEPLFDSGQVQIDFTDDGSLENLAEKLAANRYHIVHFSGHGIYQEGIGYLALEDAQTMNQVHAKAEDFAQVFQRKPENMPALVVLSSCQTAKGGLEQGMQSVADELLLKGLPAVVAMSVSVTDYFATFFASALYQNLAQKEPLFRAFQKAIAQTRQHEMERNPRIAPNQYLIPQLFVSKQIEQPVDFSKADKNLKYAAWKFVSGKESLQREKRTNYQFVGRRRDRKRIFQSLAKTPSVLLKGQGGVGKTAMAEYILQRLVAKDARVRPFIFNETNAKLDTVLNAFKSFLEERDLDEIVLDAEDKYGDHAFKQFRWLFGKIKKECTPVFIFDNLETFQSAQGKELKAEHSDVKELLEFFYQRKTPLILTCRYSVAECPDIPTFDLNQVSRNDFLKKALQLFLRALPKQIQLSGLALIEEDKDKLTFRKVIDWLHETFGGNYRALEFFDTFYLKKVSQTKDKTKLLTTLQTLANFKKEYSVAAYEARQEMSKNLLFQELLTLLDEDEKTALQLLCHFRIPVLVTALQMQRHDLDYPKLLDSLRELTLLERSVDLEQRELVYFYVTPLVKGLVRDAFDKEFEFSAELAGRYHWWVGKDIAKRNNLNDLENAFAFFLITKNGLKLNEIGRSLCNYFYSIFQFQNALFYGQNVYKINKENTDLHILNWNGLILTSFGELDAALIFYKMCLKKSKSKNDLEKHHRILINISEVYRAQSNFEEARKYLDLSLETSRQMNDKKSEVVILNNISQIIHAQGNYEEALKYLKLSLKASQTINDKKNEATILNNIAQIFHVLGDFEKALKYLEISLEVARQSGNKKDEISSLINISVIHDKRGNYQEALNSSRLALTITQQIGDKSGEAATLNNIADTAYAYKDYKTALRYFELSLEISRQIGNKSGEATLLNNISLIHDALGNYQEAMKYLHISLDLKKRIGDKQGTAVTLHNMAMLAMDNKDYKKYLEFELKSYRLVQTIGDAYSISQIGKELGVFLCRIGKIEQGLVILEKALTKSKKAKLPITENLVKIIDHFKTQQK